jgi:hypothetical protein
MAPVQVLDGTHDENIMIWRYIDYWKLEDLIKMKALYFPSINKLKELDKLEGIPSKPMEKIFNEIDQEYTLKSSAASPHISEFRYDWKKNHREHADLVYVNCWSVSENDSLWMWKNYTKPPESVAIKSTRRKLESCFNSNDLLFTRFVEYIDHENYVSGPKHSLDSFMRKNQKFTNELELRVIFDYQFYIDEAEVCDGIYESVDLNELIEQVICHPSSSDHFINHVSKLLSNNSLNINVKRSTLGPIL